MTRPRSFVLSAIAALAVTSLAGCSSDAADGGSGTVAVSTALPPTVPVISISATTVAPTSPATYTTGVFGSTQSAACDTDLTMMETAVESYLALNGGTDVTEAQLVQQGLVREDSVLHDLGPGGAVIPAPTSGCVR